MYPCTTGKGKSWRAEERIFREIPLRRWTGTRSRAEFARAVAT